MLDKNRERLKEGALAYGFSPKDEDLDRFSTYASLLVEWNEKINLTAITEEDDIVIKHFIDSLTLLPHFKKDPLSLIDVGTGAGFPGIPLKISRENLNVTLLDSLDKRIKFLNEVGQALKLKGIRAIHGRAEDMGVKPEHRERYDVAVARAVAALPVLSEYCLPFVKPGGLFIAMKGPDGEKEAAESEKAFSVLGGKLEAVEKLILPHSDNERCLILVRKCRHTPPAYPRKSGKPTKAPIK